MTRTAVALVIASAFVHASWNVIGKRSGSSVSHFAIASLTGAVVLLPLVLVWRDTVSVMPASVWWRLLPAGLFQTLYMLGLAGAYRTGEMSLAYPIARTLPVLLVPVASMLTRPGGSVSPLAMIGVFVVAGGVVVITKPRPAAISWSWVRARSLAFAVVSGIGTTGYSIVDDAALREFLQEVTTQAGAVEPAIVYVMFESLAAAIGLLLWIVLSRGSQQAARELRRVSHGAAVLTGIGIIVAYGLVVVAYGFSETVSYVVAFRQASIPLGAFLAAWVLRERLSWCRITGTAILVGGLVMVVLG